MLTETEICGVMSADATDIAPPPPGASIWQPLQCWYLPWKTGLEAVFALVLLILTSPVIAVAALLVRLTSRGPAFYKQTRLGRHCKPFTIYKLRTMRHNCESLTGPQWSKPGDTRITPLGRFLRKSHIDELPQLWNVVRGQMSLIGPRPERPEFLPALERAIPHYRDRFLVRPGVTGLAQVQLPPDTDIASVRRKLAHDLYYVRCLSPWLDLRISLCTALYLCGVSVNSLSRFLFLVPRREVVHQTYERVAARSAPAAAQLQTTCAQT
jgi:lipopolysaccharide/colanic/teichoic acid biosynthesis glycosyltransferase